MTDISATATTRSRARKMRSRGDFLASAEFGKFLGGGHARAGAAQWTVDFVNTSLGLNASSFYKGIADFKQFLKVLPIRNST